MEEYQGLLENNGLVGYAQEVLKETDQSCFVQTAKQLHLRYLLGSLASENLRWPCSSWGWVKEQSGSATSWVLNAVSISLACPVASV